MSKSICGNINHEYCLFQEISEEFSLLIKGEKSVQVIEEETMYYKN
jgi:hypothetical protein